MSLPILLLFNTLNLAHCIATKQMYFAIFSGCVNTLLIISLMLNLSRLA